MAGYKRQQTNNLHQGHRQRLIESSLHNDRYSFYEHQLLEILLFYIIPRRDTNELAHSLLIQFGSIENVLNADINALVSVDGIGTKTAEFLIKVGRIQHELKCRGEMKAINNYYVYCELCKFVAQKNDFSVIFMSNGSRVCGIIPLESDIDREWKFLPKKFMRIIRSLPIAVAFVSKEVTYAPLLYNYYSNLLSQFELPCANMVIVVDDKLYSMPSNISNAKISFDDLVEYDMKDFQKLFLYTAEHIYPADSDEDHYYSF